MVIYGHKQQLLFDSKLFLSNPLALLAGHASHQFFTIVKAVEELSRATITLLFFSRLNVCPIFLTRNELSKNFWTVQKRETDTGF